MEQSELSSQGRVILQQRHIGQLEACDGINGIDTCKKWDDSIPPLFCSNCGQKTSEMDEGQRLFRCSGCYTARYCGKACQRADWPKHKKVCKKLKELRREGKCWLKEEEKDKEWFTAVLEKGCFGSPPPKTLKQEEHGATLETSRHESS